MCLFSLVSIPTPSCASCIFLFTDTATPDTYTLSLHDALPILGTPRPVPLHHRATPASNDTRDHRRQLLLAIRSPESSLGRSDRKSTRLNSSHLGISYAVFCLKKKKNTYSR